MCHRNIEGKGQLGALSTGSIWTGGEEKSELSPRGNSRNSLLRRECALEDHGNDVGVSIF